MTKVNRPKYIIRIKNIDIEAMNEKFNLDTDKKTINKTKISELSGTSNKKTMVFFGPSKQLHKCNVSIIDHNSGNDVTKSNYCCFWCRHSFNNLSIGCPISHKPRKIRKDYVSIINGNSYTIEEDSHLYGDSVYTTDGSFCSFNCCLAYINDNKTNPIYSKSRILTMRMYNEMFNNNTTNITPAPHWRTIDVYGGHMTLAEFRDSFDKIEYQNHGITKGMSMSSIGTLFEKKLKF
jgi:hypothetical protein